MVRALGLVIGYGFVVAQCSIQTRSFNKAVAVAARSYRPPLASSNEPVTHAASVEARNETTDAISCG